jgi:hypothetical protein
VPGTDPTGHPVPNEDLKENGVTADFPDAVVVQFGQETLRGFTNRAQWSPGLLQSNDLQSPPILAENATEPTVVDMHQTKAVFFVRTFQGSGSDPILFHSNAPHKNKLWVRVRFHDGELMEGVMPNSVDLLLYDTISLVLSDPENNNLLVVFAKNQIREFHILGLRS